MRVFVLGGTGFIGGHVVRALVEAGHDVIVFHRGVDESGLPTPVRHIHGPFARLDQYRDVFRPLKPQVVLDMVPHIDKRGHGIAHFRGIAERAVVVSSGDVYRAFARLWRSAAAFNEVKTTGSPSTQTAAEAATALFWNSDTVTSF